MFKLFTILIDISCMNQMDKQKTGLKPTSGKYNSVQIYDSKTDQQLDKLRGELQEREEKIQHLSKEFNKLLLRYQEEKSAKDKISYEHQRMISDLKRTSGKLLDTTLKEENDKLRSQLNQLNIDNAELRTELDRVRTSLSKVAGERLVEGNPMITDLSDPYRPQRLAENFSSLYDNSWTDAFEVLASTKMEEQSICLNLLNMLQNCFKYCAELSNQQLCHLQQTFIFPEIRPEISKDQILEDSFPVTSSKLIKDVRRNCSKQFIPNLCQHYWTQIISKDISKDMRLKPYIEACLEVGWYSVVADPPLHYCFTVDKHEDFRGYTHSGDTIDYIVWPAMYLHQYGPLLYQGVVQFKHQNKETR